MKEDFYFDSCGSGKIHCRRWMPEGGIKAVVQLVHGIAEHIARYDRFAEHLNAQGILVVAEDHMGHGLSVGSDGVQGYFHGGWFAAVEDTYHLLEMTKEAYPDVPYVLMGHSMGSFMARTILEKHPDSGIAAAVICGTGWQPGALLSAALPVCRWVCKKHGEKNPSPRLQNLVFGGYNRRVEHQSTEFDWLCRDTAVVDAYLADPMCGFVATAGLLRDLLTGISYIQQPENLRRMEKSLPVLFIAGGDDPVGAYGKGVHQAAEAFRKAGMEQISMRLYPMGRHEILNEINKKEVYRDICQWINQAIGK